MGTPDPALTADYVANEATMAAALKPFGWTCSEDFWRRYYSDPWVFNLANAVEWMTAANAHLQERTDAV